MTLPVTKQTAQRRRIVVGGTVAVLALAVLAVLFVLPAEFGIDPTGFGKLTGLTRIAYPGMSPEQKRGALRTGVLALSETPPAPEPGKADRWEYELPAYGSIEFKYELAEGRPMTFLWQATAPLHYDMHAHPFKGGTALTESYGVGDARRMQGRYVAAFTGIHGWYWQNRSFEPVTLTLQASGGMTGSRIFEGNVEERRPLTP